MKLFQITENDLATLERELPRLLEISFPHLDNQQRSKWRVVREIVSNVRWEYGPPGSVEVIPIEENNPRN